MSSPKLLVTSGEPAGIGPDLCLMLACTPLAAHCVVLADRDVLAQRAEALRVSVTLYDESSHIPEGSGDSLRVRHVPAPAHVLAGKLDPQNAGYVISMLRDAAQDCLQGKYKGIVTCPVHKGVINDAGIPFSGHTEFFAEYCAHADVVMMLVAKTLRVALVTTHLPLSDVCRHITAARLDRTLQIIQRDFSERFHIDNARILVCGLNPHAGESGHLGREEIDIIIPVIAGWRKRGRHVSGPYPADSVFIDKYLAQADVVLAMYHDQGLPVLKHAGFGEAVNITLGLPFVRTSVDHGTAIDLAGSGTANPSSLLEAINMAMTMTQSLNAATAQHK